MPLKASKNPKKIRQPIVPRQAIALPADDDALVRESTVLAVYPVGSTSLWAQIKAGTFPKPIKIGPRTNAWVVGRLRKKLAAAADDAA